MTPAWVALAVRERIPADLIAVRGRDGDEDDERRTPPGTPVLVAVAARCPAPAVVVIDPATIVIRSPAPRLVANPRPSIRRTPSPVAVAVRCPVVIVIDDGRARTPDPAVIIRIRPVAISVQLFRAPHFLIVVAVTPIVVELRDEDALAFIHPRVPRIECCDAIHLPIASVRAVRDQLGGAPIAQGEAGSLRIDARLPA